MLKITRDELPMEQGVYGGCPLCPLYSLLVLIRDFPEDRVVFKVFHRNLALLHLRVFLLPFIVLLQNTHTTLAENVENLISAQPRISVHPQGPKI